MPIAQTHQECIRVLWSADMSRCRVAGLWTVPEGSHFGNENDHDLRSLRLSAAARSIVGVKTNFRDRNRGGQNRRSSDRRPQDCHPVRVPRERDAQIRCLAARHACYGPACYGSAETSLTGILCHPVGAILRSHVAGERPVVDDPRKLAAVLFGL